MIISQFIPPRRIPIIQKEHSFDTSYEMVSYGRKKLFDNEAEKSSTLMVTPGDNVYEKLHSSLKDHPLVQSTFQHIGIWYTNGQTKPEWLTILITYASDLHEEVKKQVYITLEKINTSASNFYWS